MGLSELLSKPKVMRSLASMSEPSKTEHCCCILLPKSKNSFPSVVADESSFVRRCQQVSALACLIVYKVELGHAGSCREKSSLDLAKCRLFESRSCYRDYQAQCRNRKTDRARRSIPATCYPKRGAVVLSCRVTCVMCPNVLWPQGRHVT
ncbi:hypothetical protein BDR22DRAFT_497687 [Usnea florida]